MLFNSVEFLFIFVPAALCGFYLLGSISPNAALRWLVVVSDRRGATDAENK
jgi:alginate O-acetyltransferase complex protein AlgI